MRIGIVAAPAAEADVLLAAIAIRREHQAVWIADSGARAVELSAQDRPDLILMSLLVGTEGIDATQKIMAETPCPILIVTPSMQTDSARVFDAIGCGALDVVEMPLSARPEHVALLLVRLANASRLIGKKAVTGAASAADPAARGHDTLVVMGASTGGPAAIAEVLRGLPDDFPAAIVVVQHVDAQFAGGMAVWLSEQSRFPVTLATPGEYPAKGRVLLANGSGHLVLTKSHRLSYSPEPRDCSYIPSVDVFFESVSRLWQGAAVGVLLTGMGGDGAVGLKAMRTRGHHTIAQDRDSSAVYGMPKAAATMNAAVDILPMGRIAGRLVEVVSGLPDVVRRDPVFEPLPSAR